MSDIAAFLTANWDEDEHRLNAAIFDVDPMGDHPLYDRLTCEIREQALRDIEAKRKIVAEHEESFRACSRCVGELAWDADHRASNDGPPMQPYPCRTLRLLAVPYTGTPGYDESWRP